MHVTGLITEYNPFHNGHLFHMDQAREAAGADYVAVLMSGSFVQRGAPAVYSKYGRARAALEAGADLVMELPVPFSTASAREFASYAIRLFNALGAVDSVCFGSESGSISQLLQAAGILLEEPGCYREALRSALRRGDSFPKARSLALAACTDVPESLLSFPNNILGVEYCRAALETKSPLSCLTIKRQGGGYHDTAAEGSLASALAIRSLLEKEGQTARSCPATSFPPEQGELLTNRQPDTAKTVSALAHLVPPPTLALMERELPVFSDDFSSLLDCRLLFERQPETYADVKPELAARIKKLSPAPASFDERVKSLKSRQLTYTAVSRALLHLLLEIRQEEMELYKAEGYVPYARILGFRREALPLLRRIKANTSVPVVTKLSAARRSLPPWGLSLLDQEVRASHLYQSVLARKRGGDGGFSPVSPSGPCSPTAPDLFVHEYRAQVIIL